MQHSYKQLIAGAALAAMGLVAIAQTPPPPPAAPAAPQQQGMQAGKGDPAKRHQMRTERMAQRLAALKQKLAITPAQEGAWTAWTSAMQPPAQPPQRMGRAEFATLTTPERIDRMRTVRAERVAMMDRRADATKTFYAALNADQKKAFDAETLQMMQRGGHRHGGHHGGRGMMMR